jgi:hypothetical protein
MRTSIFSFACSVRPGSTRIRLHTRADAARVRACHVSVRCALGSSRTGLYALDDGRYAAGRDDHDDLGNRHARVATRRGTRQRSTRPGRRPRVRLCTHPRLLFAGRMRAKRHCVARPRPEPPNCSAACRHASLSGRTFIPRARSLGARSRDVLQCPPRRRSCHSSDASLTSTAALRKWSLWAVGKVTSTAGPG